MGFSEFYWVFAGIDEDLGSFSLVLLGLTGFDWV